MRVKWEARFVLNGKKTSLVFTGLSKECEVKARVMEKHPELTDKDIYVSGAFESIPGRKVTLGTHAINSSLDLGWPYSKSGNEFYNLLRSETESDDLKNSKLEDLRKTIESKSGTPEADAAKASILRELQSRGIGVADLIDFCEAKDSKDSSINFKESVSWNPDLPDLIRNADVVYLNGRSKALECLKKYCRQCRTAEMMVRDGYIYVDGHKTKLIPLYSSSQATRSQYHEKRKKEWKAISFK